MKAGIELGTNSTGQPAALDLEELLSTRLLVQGNSGSGKSHLLRRLLEQSAGMVQQAIIDPEGDFVSFSERFGHTVVDAERSPNELQRIALRIRQHRASVVLNLEGLDAEEQMFAPAVAGEVSDEARRLSLGAMTNLMCRGRKRGLAGIVATQRLAKLAKNVAAEASNFLMGRTFLDIDMARAADLLGMDRRQAEGFRDLEPGQFVALGPALSRRPIPIRIGAVDTAGRSGRPVLMPLPDLAQADMQDLIFEGGEDDLLPMPAPSVSRARGTAELLRDIETSGPLDLTPETEADTRTEAEKQELLDAVYAEIMSDPDTAFRPAPLIYQDFLFHCRIKKLGTFGQDMPSFRKRLALARAGVASDRGDEAWQQVLAVAESLPEEMQGVFLLLARAAREEAPCPPDEALANAYGSRSPSRGRWLLTYMSEHGHIRNEVDFRGSRIVTIAGVNWRTQPGAPKAGPIKKVDPLRRAPMLPLPSAE